MTNGRTKNYDRVRAAVVEILGLIETDNKTDEDAIHDVIGQKVFSTLDMRFIRQLVNGVTKLRRRLDHDIKFYLSKPSEKLPLSLVNILRLGFYQLFFVDRIPAAAAVSESVNLAHHFVDNSRARLVNAVMRTALREPGKVVFVDRHENPARYIADFYSYPEWFVSYCLNEFSTDATEIMLAGMNQPPRFSFRVNPVRSNPGEIETILQKDGFKFSTGRYLSEYYHLEDNSLSPDHVLIQQGKIYIQDESAGLAVRLLNPKMKMSVLDMAAAPGGKALYAAVRMRNKGMITAVDKSRSRLELMMENVSRLGVKIINPVLADNLDFASQPFDRIILDVPCSGWGNAGKHSDLRWMKKPEDTDRLFKVQSMMIDKAAKLLKPGGILVYSTCTIIRKENDQVVEEFLLRRKDFTLESAAQYLSPDLVSERGFMKTYPNIENLSGAFAARLKKMI